MSDKYNVKILEGALFSYIGHSHTENIIEELALNKEDIAKIKIPKSLDIWCKNFNKKLERKQKVEKYKDMLKNISTRIAMIFLILAISFGILTTTVDAFRIKLFNMIIENNEKYLKIRIRDDTIENDINKYNLKGYYLPQYIPKGFTLDKVEVSGESRIITYLNNKGQKITFDQVPNGADFKLDYENAIRKDIKINGQDGITLSKKGRHIVFWHNDTYSFYFLADIKLKELILMAESLKLN